MLSILCSHLHPEEDNNILVKTLARISACFLAGIEELFPVQLFQHYDSCTIVLHQAKYHKALPRDSRML